MVWLRTLTPTLTPTRITLTSSLSRTLLAMILTRVPNPVPSFFLRDHNPNRPLQKAATREPSTRAPPSPEAPTQLSSAAERRRQMAAKREYQEKTRQIYGRQTLILTLTLIPILFPNHTCTMSG